MNRLSRTVRRVVVLLLAAISLHSHTLAAQGPVAAPSGVLSRCTYDTCALRLERGTFGENVREGLEGPALRLGFSGATLVGLVDRVPAARMEAERGRRQRMRGGIAATIGGAIIGSLLASTISPDATITDGHWISLIGGGVAVVYGGVQLTRSGQAFSRAVWLYNREIPR